MTGNLHPRSTSTDIYNHTREAIMRDSRGHEYSSGTFKHRVTTSATKEQRRSRAVKQWTWLGLGLCVVAAVVHYSIF